MLWCGRSNDVRVISFTHESRKEKLQGHHTDVVLMLKKYMWKTQGHHHHTVLTEISFNSKAKWISKRSNARIWDRSIKLAWHRSKRVHVNTESQTTLSQSKAKQSKAKKRKAKKRNAKQRNATQSKETQSNAMQAQSLMFNT